MIIQKIEDALKCGEAIPEREKALAEVIRRRMEQSDWDEFKEAIRYIMGEDMDKLTGEKMESLYADFIRESKITALYEKIKAEHELFLSELRRGDNEKAIKSAYQIVIKEDIVLYVESEELELTSQQYAALLSSDNALHKIYETWCDNSGYSGFSDIGKCIAETADALLR